MTTLSKTAVVTGAGSGIGRAVTRSLINAGYHVALAGRRLEALQETVLGAQDSDAAGTATTLILPTDVTDPEAVAALFDTVRKRWGRVDLLINNAGISLGGSIDELSVEDWRRSVDTNLTGMFLCAQQAVRIMKGQDPQGGRIINNGSISAHSPRPNSVAYTATKHAITGLTKAISLDGRAHNVACGQIDIGNAATELAERFAAGVPQANGRIAPEPTFDPDRVAETVVYMAGLPLDTNVQFLTIMATKMPFIGRG